MLNNQQSVYTEVSNLALLINAREVGFPMQTRAYPGKVILLNATQG